MGDFVSSEPGLLSPGPCFGLTAVDDSGAVAGYAGISFLHGTAWAFFHAGRDDVKRPMWLHRLCKRWLDGAKALGIERVFVICDEAQPRAAAWLQALGFVPAEGPLRTALVDALERETGMGAWVR